MHEWFDRSKVWFKGFAVIYHVFRRRYTEIRIFRSFRKWWNRRIRLHRQGDFLFNEIRPSHVRGLTCCSKKNVGIEAEILCESDVKIVISMERLWRVGERRNRSRKTFFSSPLHVVSLGFCLMSVRSKKFSRLFFPLFSKKLYFFCLESDKTKKGRKGKFRPCFEKVFYISFL